MLAGGGLRAVAGLALASSNGDKRRECAGARAGKFLLQAGPRTAVLRDRAWGGWLFLANPLPGMLRGPAATSLGVRQPSQAGNGHAKAKRQTQKMPPPSSQEDVPERWLSILGGDLCV